MGRAPVAGSPETLLVIDDTEANRYAVARVLKAAGYTVLEAATGREGLKLAFEHHPDAVLLDIKLPDIMGWDVCRAIKADPQMTLTPVLHVSASFTAESDRARGLEGGADGYLVHPVDPGVLVATVRSLLRLRKANEALRRSEQRLQQIVDHAPVILFKIDTEGRYAFFSGGSALRAHGMPPQAMIGRSINELHRGDPEFLQNAKRALSGESFTDEVPVAGRWFEIRYSPLPPTEEAGGFLGVATDVTDRRRAEASREEVLAVLAHDLRSPVAAIRFNLDALERVMKHGTPGTTTPEDMIHRLRQSAERAERLIADLLDRAQMESGGFRIERSSLDALRLAREAAELMMPIAAAKGVRFLLDVPSDSCTLLGDRSRLLQAMSNLIENAIKFAPSRDGSVELRLSRQDREFLFCVSDNGPGMSEEQVARVFDRFWRGRRDGRQGIGLGLAIAKGIVEAHGGRIWAEGQPGAGARFCFVIPQPAPRPGA
jgi:PAS domain S-box-containing protein